MAACQDRGEAISDVDVAVQLVSKEADFGRLREASAERVDVILGQHFRSFLEEQFCWFWKTFGFYKGGPR